MHSTQRSGLAQAVYARRKENMNQLEIKQGTIENIDLIKPLWEELNQIHYNLSLHFKDRYQNMTWDKRKRTLLEKSNDMLFEYVVDTNDNNLIGYCISTIEKHEEKTGEIDSIYIGEKYRKSGVGKRLIENAVSWFNSNNIETQKLMVAVGNEQVLNFYDKFNFYPAHIILKKRT
ncbi:MAG: GNAT family N-acetyltransferase [Marinilabiliaceae bacterium]|nr:GNAT family N-acetyltransferase [Marinilabiliaceae bacterium]